MRQNIRLGDIAVEEGNLLRDAEFVVLENFGLGTQGEIQAYVPIMGQGGESGEFYRYTWVWDGDEEIFDMDVNRSRVMVHNIELLDLREGKNPTLEQYVPDEKIRGDRDE